MRRRIRKKKNRHEIHQKNNQKSNVLIQRKAKSSGKTNQSVDALNYVSKPVDYASVMQRDNLSHSMNEHQRVNAFTSLQRQYGNRFVQSVMAQPAIQAQLKVGKPGDIYEKEADNVAKKIMRNSEPQVQKQADKEEEKVQTKLVANQITQLVQMKAEPEEKKEEQVQKKAEPEEEKKEQVQKKSADEQYLHRQEEEEEVQTKLMDNKHLQRQTEEKKEEEKGTVQKKSVAQQNPQISSGLTAKIQERQSGGEPLSSASRAFFEPRFRHDLSRVRIHTDAVSVELARAINAKAFTIGRDIVFGAGQYEPKTRSGRQLLAHELTHILQQGQATPLNQEASKPVTGSKPVHEPSVRRISDRLQRQKEPKRKNTGAVFVNSGGTAYYDVSGKSLADVGQQLDPEEWGRCGFRYEYSYEESGGTTNKIDVTVTISYRMPRWSGETWEKASASAKREWNRMIDSLWIHERGHANIAEKGANTIRQGLLNQPVGDIESAFQQLKQNVQNESDAYDSATSHGQTQGVGLDTSIK